MRRIEWFCNVGIRGCKSMCLFNNTQKEKECLKVKRKRYSPNKDASNITIVK